MNLRWLIGNFTDPQYELSFRDQMRLSLLAHKHHLSATRFWSYSLITIAIPVGIIYKYAIPAILNWLGYKGYTPAYTWAIAILIFLVWLYSAWVYRSLYIKPIRLAMRSEGYDLCINCGYELKGLGEDIDRCPECGAMRKGQIKQNPNQSADL